MKVKLKKTGEVVELIYTLTKGNETIYGDKDLVEYKESDFINIDDNIDWERRRYQIAKGIMIQRSTMEMAPEELAEEAIRYADILIEKLKENRYGE